MAAIRILLGLALLVVGRKLFWIFVGAVGFVAGMQLSSLYLRPESELVLLIIALIGGILGALLAVFVQRLAVAIAGFLVGAYLVYYLFMTTGWNTGGSAWLIYLAGGVLGAILVAVLFDWALVILSSLSGALLVIQGLDLRPGLSIALFLVLTLVGIILQGSMLRGKKRALNSQ